jgi:hypothetical protein
MNDIVTIQEALTLVQKELKAPKGKFNAFGKFKYRHYEDIFAALKPVMPKDCLVTVTDDLIIVGTRYYIKATATFSRGAEKIECVALAREQDEKKGMDQSQITGTTSSYARKYALVALFAIDGSEATDPDQADVSDIYEHFMKRKRANEMDSARKELLQLNYQQQLKVYELCDSTEKAWMKSLKEAPKPAPEPAQEAFDPIGGDKLHDLFLAFYEAYDQNNKEEGLRLCSDLDDSSKKVLWGRLNADQKKWLKDLKTPQG